MTFVRGTIWVESQFILESMGKRKFGFWESWLQISPEKAMDKCYTILESTLIDAKDKNVDPSGGILTPLPEKIGKKQQKWPKMAIFSQKMASKAYKLL